MLIQKHMSWYQKHIVKNSEIIINKKVKLMLNFPIGKKCTLTDGRMNSREVGTDFEKLYFD